MTIELEGRYVRGRGSVDEYLEQTAIANPHVTIHYIDPEGERDHLRAIDDAASARTAEIKPHPYGIELGQLVTMLKDTAAGTMSQFLTESFSRVSPGVAQSDLRSREDQHAIQSQAHRPPGSRRAVSGDSEHEDQRSGNRLHFADRRAADSQGTAPAGAGRVLLRGDAASGGVSRQSVSDRSRIGIWRRQSHAESHAGHADRVADGKRCTLAPAVPADDVRRHRRDRRGKNSVRGQNGPAANTWRSSRRKRSRSSTPQ